MHSTMVNIICDSLRKDGFAITHKKPHPRGLEIWLEHEVKVYVYRDRTNAFIEGKGKNARYLRSVVNCLSKRMSMKPTFFYG